MCSYYFLEEKLPDFTPKYTFLLTFKLKNIPFFPDPLQKHNYFPRLLYIYVYINMLYIHSWKIGMHVDKLIPTK